MRYKIVDIPEEPMIQEAFDLACERLNVDWLSMGFYELTDDPQEKDIVRSKWSGEPVEGEEQSGFMLTMSDSVWINASMSLREIIITIGHEVWHCHALWQPTIPNTEAAAEGFGLKIWQELQGKSSRKNLISKMNRKHQSKTETRDEIIQRLNAEIKSNKQPNRR